MPGASARNALIGIQPFGNFATPDSVQRHKLGTIIEFDDPYWGGIKAIYLQFDGALTTTFGAILQWDTTTTFYNATTMGNTINLGNSFGILANKLVGSTTQQYGWAVIGGVFPVLSNASVATNVAIGIVGAGRAGALAAGKQLLGARVVRPATTTVAKANCSIVTGSPVLKAPNTDGWFVGMPISGTGIPASTTVSGLDQDGSTVTMSANATANNSITATGTYNDGTTNYWNVISFVAGTMQGPIT